MLLRCGTRRRRVDSQCERLNYEVILSNEESLSSLALGYRMSPFRLIISTIFIFEILQPD